MDSSLTTIEISKPKKERPIPQRFKLSAIRREKGGEMDTKILQTPQKIVYKNQISGSPLLSKERLPDSDIGDKLKKIQISLKPNISSSQRTGEVNHLPSLKSENRYPDISQKKMKMSQLLMRPVEPRSKLRKNESYSFIQKEDAVRNPYPARSKVTNILQAYLQKEQRKRYHSLASKQRLGLGENHKQNRKRQRKVNVYFPTVFEIEPNFYKMQTEYARQFYFPRSVENVAQPVSFNWFPKIPESDNFAQFINSYESVSKEIDIQQLVALSNFYITYSPGEMYFGEMEKGMMDGIGVLLTSKSCYEGLFATDKKKKGVEIDLNGIYRGEYSNNKRQGVGEYQSIDGSLYSGEWGRDVREGNGSWHNKQGDRYDGEWRNNKFNGYGVLIMKDREYRGNFVDSKKQGWGRQKFSNGDICEGEFRNDLPHGKGTYVWTNGTKYMGQFFNGFRTGQGSLSTVNGCDYSGIFVDEKAEGLCQITFSNGDVYQGYLKDGTKTGRGVLIIAPSGGRLDGFWQNDIL